VRAVARFSRAIHPANSSQFTPGSACHRTPLRKGERAGINYPLYLWLIAHSQAHLANSRPLSGSGHPDDATSAARLAIAIIVLVLVIR
jgi:hypothetical protein